jgi:hypothetical protein
MRRLLTFAAVMVSCVVFAPSFAVAADAACAEQVLADWSDNGRIDRLYALPCYDQAIAAMPTDIRDYTNAQDVIERALTTAARASTDDRDRELAAARTSDASTPPLALLGAAGLALAVLAAGLVGFLERRSASGRRGSGG